MRLIPFVYKHYNTNGISVPFSASVSLSIKNAWNSHCVDFSIDPPQDSLVCVSPSVLMDSYQEFVQVTGAYPSVTLEDMVSGSDPVVLLDNVNTPSGVSTWFMSDPPSDNILNISTDSSGSDVKVSYLKIDDSTAYYSLDPTSLSDGRYIATITFGEIRSNTEFSVKDGYPVPEAMLPDRYGYLVDLSFSAEGEPVTNAKFGIFLGDRYFTGMSMD